MSSPEDLFVIPGGARRPVVLGYGWLIVIL
jgi:hypothetical protein